MALLDSKEIQLILQKPAVFVCGKDEQLKIDIINSIIELISDSQLNCLYFISPSDELVNYLDVVLDEDKFKVINEIPEANILNQNIIACGFSIFSEDLKYLKKLKSNQILIFIRETGSYKTGLERGNKHIKVVEDTFENFTLQYQARSINPSPEVINAEYDYFANREEEKDRYRDFAANSIKRALIVAGMPGIGKRAFIRELKRNYGLNPNCFELSFNDRTNSLLDDILSPLFDKLAIKKFTQKSIQNIKLKNNRGRIPDEIKALFEAFDRLSNAKIIFWNIEEIYNFSKGSFYREEIALFFRLIIERDSFRTNKIYFISNNLFEFNGINLDYIEKVELHRMTACNIKLIITQKFSYKNYPEYAQAIKEVEDAEVDNLLCGHPYLAIRFVDAGIHFGVEAIFSDPVFRRNFEVTHKIRYINEQLLNKKPLSEEDKELLSHLTLFKDHIDTDYLAGLTPESPQKILDLKARFLLETESRRHSAMHYVPTLIKDYIFSQVTDEKLKENHTKIGDFFWNKIEKFRTPTKDLLECYNLSLYHYEKAENREKQTYLISRFTEKFLEKANDFYEDRDYENAYFYFNAVSEKKELGKEDLTRYLISCGKIGLENTENLFVGAIKQYPDDIFLKNSYLEYLFEKEEYSAAENFYLETQLSKKDTDFVTKNIYAKILAKTGRQEQAYEIYEQRLSKYNQKHLTDRDKTQGVRDCTNYCAVLGADKAVEDLKSKSEQLLGIQIERAILINEDTFTVIEDDLNIVESVLSRLNRIATRASEFNATDSNSVKHTAKLQALSARLKNEFEEIDSSIKLKKQQFRSRLGKLQGDFFEKMIGELLSVKYPQREVQIRPNISLKYQSNWYEYDFVVINPSRSEVVVIEVKGYNERRIIELGEYDTARNTHTKETVRWFFNHTFPKFKEASKVKEADLIPTGFKCKCCYITSASFSQDAYLYLQKLQDSSSEKPEDLDIFYDREKLIGLLQSLGLKKLEKELDQHF